MHRDVKSHCAKLGSWIAQGSAASVESYESLNLDTDKVALSKKNGNGPFWTAAKQIIAEQANAIDRTAEVKYEKIVELQTDSDEDLREMRRCFFNVEECLSILFRLQRTTLIRLHLAHLQKKYAAFYQWVFTAEDAKDNYLRTRVRSQLDKA